MPPASKKDASIILFDLKASPLAKKTLVKICCKHFLTQSKDLTKLVLLNSATTHNGRNLRHGGYNNINEVSEDPILYNPNIFLNKIEANQDTAEANWLEGLLLALKTVEDDFEDINGIITRQVVFLTDLETPVTADDSLINKIKGALEKSGAYLYVIGPKVKPTFQIKSKGDVNKWMESFQTSTENQSILKRIFSGNKNCVVCDYQLGFHLLFNFKNFGGTQPWQVPLAIGSKIQIPAQTMKVLSDTVECNFKSTSGSSREYMWIDAYDESIEVDATDVVSGIMRHEKFVQMPENKMFQVENPRGFSVLCFTDSVNVPEYIMRGEGAYMVLPNSTPKRNQALYALIDCLEKQNKYIIARRVYNNNYLPRIVVLIPKAKHSPKCFLMATLPFGEDVRFNYREGKLERAGKTEIASEVDSFLNSINVEENPDRAPIGTDMMVDLNTSRIINKVADKIFDKYMNLDEVDLDLFQAAQSECYDKLKNAWSERELKFEKSEEQGDDSDDGMDWD